ncbi:FliI/YscN family ATPase [Priestia megaterium]|uniref:FliI/YscN family ATPase n=1 Tax=Priestia megaterium TaxID=1404 RepID=UPI002E21ABE5|nr:FliI/YscN family ATPase [Priestia megaterium]MED4285438.1 FliI/YscN family ATPase [Priestia megaterium]
MTSLAKLNEQIQQNTLLSKAAVVESVYENFVITKGPVVSIGSIFEKRESKLKFEVVGIKGENNVLMPLSTSDDLVRGDKLFPTSNKIELPQNPYELLGNVLDAYGDSLEGYTFKNKVQWKSAGKPPSPLKRARIKEPIETKIKAIDGFLTIGRGQKIGIFAGTGVGKSTLLGLLAKQSTEDVNVIALIGERGREVREFIERELGEEGMKRSVVVVSTSDESSLMQIKAAELATRIAEEFREKGKRVLLMMDSVTRYAMARRVLDIANGDIPLAGGRTLGMEPSLQRLLERSGNNERGSITGIYTVLVENDDFNGPIPDMARGILDGHIVLTRRLADKNHFPAIDVLASVSRVMQEVVDENHWQVARSIKKYLSIYNEVEDQYNLGLIEKGKDTEIDRSVLLNRRINELLRQDIKESYDKQETLQMMNHIIS